MTHRSLSGPWSPLDAPHDGWTLLPPRSETGLKHSFVSGDPDGMRLRVVYFMRDEDLALVGRAWFGPLAEGPPAHAHGGSMAALLDEAMGAACWLAGHRVLAAKIEIEFKRPLPLGSTVELVARVARVEGRRVHAEGELVLRAPDGTGGTVCARGTGLFVEVAIEKLRSIVGDTDGPIG